MKTALVTGSNSGFGLLIALELAQLGFHVAATMRNIENRGELLLKGEQLGISDRIMPLQMDVTNREEIIKAKEEIESAFGKLTCLINNAGYCQGGFFEDLTAEQWESQFRTNVAGTFAVTKTFLPLLEKSDPGYIINIGSISGFFGFPGMSAYCSSKFALEGMSESLRLELLPKKIYVTMIEPASYQTKIWEKALKEVHIDESADTYKKQIFAYAKNSAKNGADPAEVAKLVGKIVQTKKPRLRYQIGKNAKLLAIAKHYLPWRWIEKIVIKKLQ